MIIRMMQPWAIATLLSVLSTYIHGACFLPQVPPAVHAKMSRRLRFPLIWCRCYSEVSSFAGLIATNGD